jgi:GNAT superfamily N-acetyltransferase
VTDVRRLPSSPVLGDRDAPAQRAAALHHLSDSRDLSDDRAAPAWHDRAVSTGTEHRVRRATVDEAATVATLLDDFNREFDTPTPGVEVLTERLRDLLAGDDVVSLLIGQPAVGIAVVSFRRNVWYAGPVALLDELYVRPNHRNRRLGHALLEAAGDLARQRGCEVLEINVDGDDTDARRFYEAHGFTHTEPGATQPMFYYYRELP